MQDLIKTFNTGAGYRQEGRRIAYMPLVHRGGDLLVAMVDVDRGIDYVLKVGYPYDDGAVAQAYLNNRIERSMWLLPQLVKDLLRDAALAHGKEASHEQ